MSAIHKLLCTGLSLALVIGASGCRSGAANHVSFDSMSGDKTELNSILGQEGRAGGAGSLTVPRWRLWSEEERESEEEASGSGESEYQAALAGRSGTIGDITPAYRETVRERYRLNPYSVGWLSIPGTSVDDVVMKNPKSLNNDYYLNHDFNNNPDRDGMYCADYRTELYNPREELSRITAIYGHSWDENPDGALFSQLKKYRDEQFAREHPYIFFSNAYDDMVWEVFAVFDTTIHLPYIRPKMTKDTFYSVIDMVGDLSLYHYDTTVDYSDKILTLSTCTYSVQGHPSLPLYNDYRFVIMAKLAEPEERARNQAALTPNPSPLPPDATLVFKTP